MTNPERLRPLTLILIVLLVTGVAGILLWALWSMQPVASGLSLQVREHLPVSGVNAEVTAILMNFRGYDTLLEMAVLLAALLGVWHLGPLQLPQADNHPDPILETLVRFLTPVIILVTGYVLWLGGHAVGGAFQAGALLAGAGVLLLMQPRVLVLRDHLVLRIMIVAGAALFTFVAGMVMFTGGTLLEYPKQYAGALILLIEAASTVSIGLILTLLFAGGAPRHGDKE